jgi:hypothetical protein
MSKEGVVSKARCVIMACVAFRAKCLHALFWFVFVIAHFEFFFGFKQSNFASRRQHEHGISNILKERKEAHHLCQLNLLSNGPLLKRVLP